MPFLWRDLTADLYILITPSSFQYLNHPGVAFCMKMTDDENAITNAVEIYETSK